MCVCVCVCVCVNKWLNFGTITLTGCQHFFNPTIILKLLTQTVTQNSITSCLWKHFAVILSLSNIPTEFSPSKCIYMHMGVIQSRKENRYVITWIFCSEVSHKENQGSLLKEIETNKSNNKMIKKIWWNSVIHCRRSWMFS